MKRAAAPIAVPPLVRVTPSTRGGDGTMRDDTMRDEMTRREWLSRLGACPLLGQPLVLGRPLAGQALAGQALAESGPQNLSFPLGSIEGAVTPPDLFFVRDHFSEPELSLSSWKLTVSGRVAHPLEFSLADLIEAPTKKVEAVLECAGNAAGGSAVSNAVWEGVPLAWLLKEAGAVPETASVVLEGADSGRLMQDSPQLPYCQLVPLAKCMRPESLVAFKLNDRFLPRKNGFPTRALLPGWYAMDSVKWLRRIIVLGPENRNGVVEPSEFQASGMSTLYNRIVESAPGTRNVTRLSEVLVKSAVAWPADNARLPVGRHVVRGFAWTGSGIVRGVQISADAGRSWAPATLESRPAPFRWVRWRYSWAAPAGDHVLMSRAADDAGREQPIDRDPARKDGYELNYCARVRCVVR